ncbi:hypothetical protein [Xanthomonas euvesicatoria]|uniref:hypothetical protein n=1 Tax=Xanthomonas euvesicatoria TaxID=456327 RepID=UPI001C48BC49|nr:hypothetical protein [Xanthomonas euvesicatoria]MBV6851338.1 hypothetical protein [Xanthomonas campestris pv. heliotropii]
MTIVGTEFDVCVSISDFIIYPDENSEKSISQPTLLAVFDELGLAISPRDLYAHYFANEKLGTGRVQIYKSHMHAETVVAFDLYRDKFEQLDLVSFSLACSTENLPLVAAKLRAFFDCAEYQIALQQVSHSSRLRKMLDASK